MSKPQNTPSGQNGNIEEYDLVILGSGTGGTIAAWTFASNGQRVAVIEPQICRWLVSEYRVSAEPLE